MTDAQTQPQPHASLSEREALALWGAYLWALSTVRRVLSHDLRSPLMPLSTRANLIQEIAARPEIPPGELRQRILHNVGVMPELLEGLALQQEQALDRLRLEPDPGAPPPRIGALLNDFGRILHKHGLPRDRHVTVTTGDHDPIMAAGLPGQQALFVLLVLAVDDLPKGGTLEVSLDREGSTGRVALRQRRNDGKPGVGGWWNAREAPVGPPGILSIVLKTLEVEGVGWTPPASPDEPIVLRWHLEGTET